MHTHDRTMNECPTTSFVSEMICSFGCDLHVMRAFSAADWIEMENRKGGDIWQGYYSVILSVKFHVKWFTGKLWLNLDRMSILLLVTDL